jgi:hypothetical protein
MATRAERFRASQERSGPKRPPKPPAKPRSYKADTSRPAVSAADRRHGGKSAARNVSLAAGKKTKAAFELEDSVAPKRPSRKSTRKSKNRQKAGTQLKARAQRAVSSPQRRHEIRK